MATAQVPSDVLIEIADFLAKSPSRDDLLRFRPSVRVQERARELLLAKNEGRLTPDEQRELDQFEQAEVLMRLIKAKVHAANSP